MNTHHPRFGQRLQISGGILLVIWITAQMHDHLGQFKLLNQFSFLAAMFGIIGLMHQQ